MVVTPESYRLMDRPQIFKIKISGYSPIRGNAA